MMISYNCNTIPGKGLSLYSLGLEWNELAIVSYNSLWPAIYKTEAERIYRKLFPWVCKLEHVGSTSVWNMKSKPIIDIIAAVSSIGSILNYLESFQELGYRYLGECGRPGRYFFTYSRATVTYFHLHIVSGKSSYWHNLVSFRDKLRTDRELRYRYLQHKLYLMGTCRNNRRKYREEKEEWFTINDLQQHI